MDNVDFSLIIPTLNESENIRELLRTLSAVLSGVSHEIIVVDDNSPDGTGALVEQAAQSDPAIRLIVRKERNGLSAAVIEGFMAARGKYLGVMDADFSHDQGLLLHLIEAVQNGVEMAIGSRRVKGGGADHWPWYRRGLSSAATRIGQWWLSLNLKDPMSGFFVLRREVFESVKNELNPKGYKILLELFIRARVKNFVEVPFIFKDRKQGHSKLTTSVAVYYLSMLWDLRSYSTPFHWLRSTYHTGRYKKVRKSLKDGKTLDIGCGRPCETMDEQAFLRYLNRPGSVGVDIKPMKGSYEFHQASITALPFKGPEFDNVVAMEVLEHITEVELALSEINKVLKPGGVFIMSTPDCHPVWEFFWHRWTKAIGQMWHDAHVTEWTARQWKESLGKKFTVLGVQRHWVFDMIFTCRKDK